MALSILYNLKWRIINSFMRFRHISMHAPDKFFLTWQFHNIMGYDIDWKNPETFNEKMNWLKINDRNPLYTRLVDKVAVKDLVADNIGRQHVIPILAKYNSVDEIDLDKLPDRFVLKCNHDSGSSVVCRDKRTFDFQAAKQKLDAAMKSDYYLFYREWPYKNVKKCVFAEQYIADGNRNALVDYKFFCFDGEPKIMYIGADKADYPTSDFYDMDFNHLPIRILDSNSQVRPSKPECFEQMKSFASILAKGIPCVRIDFYMICGKVYFGEYTFYHLGGYAPIHPKEWDEIISRMIKIPQNN